MSHDFSRRSHLKLQHVAAVVLIVAGGTWGAIEIHERLTHVYESDARISGDLITISSRVAGWVTKITVTEGQAIQTNDVLAQVDSRESALLVRQMESKFSRVQADRERLKMEKELTEQQTKTLFDTRSSALEAAKAVVSSLKPQLDLARTNKARAESLFRTKVIPRRQLDEARSAMQRIAGEYQGALAQFREARARIEEARAERARLGVLDAQIEMLRHEESELRAMIDQQALDLSDRTIRAPVNGVVDKTFVEVGEYITPGQRLAVVHDPAYIWIEANIKETDIRKLKIGQPVEVLIDAYPDEKFSGKVAIIGNSTTSEFALLPTPNPSGNFTKITQRLPVRIAIGQHGKKLRPGMMVEVNIDIRDR
jgi:membrane fusion protein (multidrug efflux system)